MTLLFVAAFLIIAALAACAIAGVRIARERNESQRVRAIFSRYVSPQVAEELLSRDKLRAFEGRSRHATILVCRIWNFNKFAEDLSTEETLRYLNEFYALAGTSIQKHRGMIDRFLGDGIVGAFGVPVDDPHQNEHALRAALDIVRLVDVMHRRWAAEGRKPFRAGIGINSGTIIAGDVGYANRRDYMLIGREVRVAMQLQEATNDLGAYIIASKATCDIVKDTFALVPVQRVPLPGGRSMADGFIVRGLARDHRDGLLLPPQASFRRTTIVGEDGEIEAEHPPQSLPVAAKVPPPVATPMRPRATPAAPQPNSAVARAIEMSKIEHPVAPPPLATRLAPAHFSASDDTIPVFPQAPLHATYEDEGGDPFELPV